MPALTAADFDTASLIANIAIAGGAVLAVTLVVYGWKKIPTFFR